MQAARARRQSQETPGPRAARVLGVVDARAQLELSPGGERHSAHNAVLDYRPHAGDRVLVQTGSDAQLYVVGVLEARGPRELRSDSGATASVEGDAITLRDSHGHTLLSFDAASGELRLSAGAGDLRLEAAHGRVVIEGQGVELKVGELLAEATRVAWRCARWELSASRRVERAAELYCDVESVLETRAGQLRTFVSEALELFGRRVRVKSEEDTSIDGRRILLG